MTSDRSPILRWFKSDNLPEHIRGVAEQFEKLAIDLDIALEPGAEKATALRKILEAKDAALRAVIEMKERW